MILIFELLRYIWKVADKAMLFCPVCSTTLIVNASHRILDIMHMNMTYLYKHKHYHLQYALPAFFHHSMCCIF